MNTALYEDLSNREFDKEMIFQTSRSSGPGGQHVNKTETKVELRFHVENSLLLSFTEKELIKVKLANKINGDGYFQITSQISRSQLANKQYVLKQFIELLCIALTRNKKRIATRPSRNSKEKRINNKKRHSLIKNLRNKMDF